MIPNNINEQIKQLGNIIKTASQIALDNGATRDSVKDFQTSWALVVASIVEKYQVPEDQKIIQIQDYLPPKIEGLDIVK